MTNRATKLVKQKRKVYSKYKDKDHPAYKKIAAKAAREVRNARRRFEIKLSANIKKDSKSFYAYVRSKSSSKVKAGPLIHEDGSVIESDKEMAEQLNKYFSSVFTDEDTTHLPMAEQVFGTECGEALTDIEGTPPRLLCSESSMI